VGEWEPQKGLECVVAKCNAQAAVMELFRGEEGVGDAGDAGDAGEEAAAVEKHIG
jgi:hypothetical protein